MKQKFFLVAVGMMMASGVYGMERPKRSNDVLQNKSIFARYVYPTCIAAAASSASQVEEDASVKPYLKGLSYCMASYVLYNVVEDLNLAGLCTKIIVKGKDE